jgi:hypothetical protein
MASREDAQRAAALADPEPGFGRDPDCDIVAETSEASGSMTLTVFLQTDSH